MFELSQPHPHFEFMIYAWNNEIVSDEATKFEFTLILLPTLLWGKDTGLWNYTYFK